MKNIGWRIFGGILVLTPLIAFTADMLTGYGFLFDCHLEMGLNNGILSAMTMTHKFTWRVWIGLIVELLGVTQ